MHSRTNVEFQSESLEACPKAGGGPRVEKRTEQLIPSPLLGAPVGWAWGSWGLPGAVSIGNRALALQSQRLSKTGVGRASDSCLLDTNKKMGPQSHLYIQIGDSGFPTPFLTSYQQIWKSEFLWHNKHLGHVPFIQLTFFECFLHSQPCVDHGRSKLNESFSHQGAPPR